MLFLFRIFLYLLFENCRKSRYENNEDQDGKNELEIRLEPLGHFHTLTCVTFLKVVIKAPAEAGNAEEKVSGWYEGFCTPLG